MRGTILNVFFDNCKYLVKILNIDDLSRRPGDSQRGTAFDQLYSPKVDIIKK